MTARFLALFAKYWQPGCVKTRLAADLGDQAASHLSREFLATLTARFSRLAARRYLVFTPADRRSAFEHLCGPAWICTPQVEGDLGARLAAFFDWAFATGARQLVVMGGDSPTIPLDYIAQSWRLLDNHDLVLGPTDDGGYYLVAASHSTPDIFSDIPWSTSSVYAATLDRANRRGLRVATLPTWYDIDELRDLERLREELAGLGPEFFELRKLLDSDPDTVQ